MTFSHVTYKPKYAYDEFVQALHFISIIFIASEKRFTVLSAVFAIGYRIEDQTPDLVPGIR